MGTRGKGVTVSISSDPDIWKSIKYVSEEQLLGGFYMPASGDAKIK